MPACHLRATSVLALGLKTVLEIFSKTLWLWNVNWTRLTPCCLGCQVWLALWFRLLGERIWLHHYLKNDQKNKRWCLIFLNPTGRNSASVFNFYLWLLTVFAWQKYLNWWTANDAVTWRVFWFSCVQWDVFCCCCFGCLCYSGVSVSPWGEGNIDVLATALWTVKILAFTNMVELFISIIDP